MNIPVLEKIKENILNPFILFLIVLALLYFFYGVYKFVSNYDNETGRSEGKSHMIWGIVGLTIMVSVYGVISVIKETIAVIK